MRLFFVVFSALLLTACIGPSINQFQLTRLDKGMTASDVKTRLEQEPRGTVSVVVGSRNFEVSRYLFGNGMQYDAYYLLYEQKKLLYWGYVSDFRRHPDPTIGQAIDAALPKFGPIR